MFNFTLGFYISGVIYLLETIPLPFSKLIHAIIRLYNFKNESSR